MKADEYQCAMCGGIYTKGWSEQEARAETQQYWPDTPQEELAVICDDCWQGVQPETHPVEYVVSLYDQAWNKYMAHAQQTIAKMFEIPPSLLGNSGVIVDGSVQPSPLQIKQEADNHE
jgi:hypothetical protein